MKYEWATSLKAQCADHEIAYYMKQKGVILAKELACKDHKGGNPEEGPQELQVQEFPKVA